MNDNDIAKYRDEWPQYWSEILSSAEDEIVPPLDTLFKELDGLNQLVVRDRRSAWVELRFLQMDGRWTVFARPLVGPRNWTPEQALRLLSALDRFNSRP